MPDPTAKLSALDAACRDWREILGAGGIVRSPDVLRRYGRTTLPSAPVPAAVLLPRSTEHVAAAVRVASTHRVPLYPISRGKNWGWGDACPVTEGQAILDLSALDRILEVDEELGYAVVQPGVTQRQLADRLAQTGSAWWFDSTSAGPPTSLVGNAIERGVANSERFAQVCGLEVVLADGSVVRTGSGHYPGSRVDHAARWGVGPALDGLFSQSNLGIVTELGFWLQPRPASALVGYFTVPDAGLEFGVDLLRPFRIRGVLPVLNLYLVSGRDGAPMWFGIVGVYGSAKAVAVQREELEAACAQPATIAFLSPMDAEDPAARRATLEALGLPTTPFFDELLRGSSGLLTGEAVEFSPDAVLTYLGGAAVQHPTGPPRSIDPLDHDYGFYFLWPTCPALGREVRALLDLVRQPLAAHGFPSLFALKFVNGRAIVLVMRIAFDRKLAERRGAARACYRAIVDATIAAGYPPARMGIDGMDRLDPAGDTYWQLVRRLKGCLDPEGILAPGRYLPPEPQVFPVV